MASAQPQQMLAADILKHPEYPHVVWDLKPAAKGRITVAAGRRGGPVNIAYEVHGHGPTLLVWIMGLGALKTAWQRQTKDFAHTHSDKYTSLIFDNRGVGESDKPFARYSTSQMALDALDLLAHLGWTDRRQLHVIGISMGGMIAQELAIQVPDRIASLSLVSTAAYIFNTLGVIENFRNRVNMFIPRSIDVQLANVKRNMFSDEWVGQPDTSEFVAQAFPTNGDRFAAGEVNKRSNPNSFTRSGFISQALAAGWHHKSAEQLKQIADKVGRERIQVIHGTEDRMIPFPHAKILTDGLGGENSGLTIRFIEGQGHVVPVEMREDFFNWVAALAEKGEKLNKQQTVSSKI